MIMIKLINDEWMVFGKEKKQQLSCANLVFLLQVLMFCWGNSMQELYMCVNAFLLEYLTLLSEKGTI